MTLHNRMATGGGSQPSPSPAGRFLYFRLDEKMTEAEAKDDTGISRLGAGLLKAAKAQADRRAAEMPTEQDAIDRMFQCYQRLKELGWNDAIYCPKDGTVFDVIEAGSTGIFPCHYQGEWPKGSWWTHANEDLWPSRPTVFRTAWRHAE